MVGASWAVAAVGINIALAVYSEPISRLASLHNCGALLVALFAIFFLGEAEQVNIWRLLPGSVLIAIGAILVVNS